MKTNPHESPSQGQDSNLNKNPMIFQNLRTEVIRAADYYIIVKFNGALLNVFVCMHLGHKTSKFIIFARNSNGNHQPHTKKTNQNHKHTQN